LPRAAAGFLPAILLLAAYHQLAFGSPFHTGYHHLVNPAFTAYHARGFLGVGAPSLRALAAHLFDPARGLFLWAPFLALGVPGLWLLARHDRPLAILCGAELALYAAFAASFNFEAWGWSVGPRHVATLCAFLVPPALTSAVWLRERGAGFVASALALAGMAKLALTVAVCPYLPEELTNPVWQLVVPLARAGLRARTAVELASGGRATWSLLPWAAVAGAAWAAIAAPLSVRAEGGAPARRAALPAALTLLLAVALLAADARLGGADRFAATRAFMAQAFAR
jgi:hypothetical protein